MKTLFTRFVKDESGATAIEYGLIAASSPSPASRP
ncbi:MAG: Flp/Fap pilin component [Microvirga sp.]|nr:Flp/Fap pilin component [Microvirga sp.]